MTQTHPQSPSGGRTAPDDQSGTATREPTDEPSDAPDRFPRPPLSFTDAEDRQIAVERYDDGVDPLEQMYTRFDTASKAQGIPPREASRRRDWLDSLLADGMHVVARFDGRVVGHATLMPMDDGTAELAIFIDPEFQHAGIGSRLIRALLGVGQTAGVGDVWLTVQRDNEVAIALYQSVGFETTGGRLELEMERPL